MFSSQFLSTNCQVVVGATFRVEQAFSLRILKFPWFGTIGGRIPIDHTILVIHHPQYYCLIGGIYWSDGNVSNGSELTAVVQVFVLKTEEVPNEASEKTINN